MICRSWIRGQIRLPPLPRCACAADRGEALRGRRECTPLPRAPQPSCTPFASITEHPLLPNLDSIAIDEKCTLSGMSLIRQTPTSLGIHTSLYGLRFTTFLLPEQVHDTRW